MESQFHPWLTTPALVGLATVFLTALLLSLHAPKNKKPLLINGKDRMEFSSARVKKNFMLNARALMKGGLERADVFRIESDNGIKTVLAPKYAPELRSHPDLSFGASIAIEFHAHVSGFEPFKQGTEDRIFSDAIRLRLTQSLGNVTKPLSDETSFVLREQWTDNTDWHDVGPLHRSILRVVSQLSSKVFLGDQICRNDDWLRITSSYTVDSFIAARELREWPFLIRPLVAKLLPSCRKINQQLQKARDIITPVLQERRRMKDEAIRTGQPPTRYHDAMEWMEDIADGRDYDPAVAQILFSVAAIHTTSDMLTQVLLDLCGKEQLVQELRKEVITTIEEEGWKKSTLYKMKLMDSVLKESQRLKPIGIASMRRIALKDINLSDGTFIPQGTSTFVSVEKMWDSDVYSDPEQFDPYRFLRLREKPGHETSSQLVSPSPEHLGFGYGKHACPGRFFAANEVKIALCHILLKYDFKLAPESVTPVASENGVSLTTNPHAKIVIRRRQEELSL